MKKNKMIISHCPNFYKIIDFEFPQEDKITAKLIEIYKEYIFKIDLSVPLQISKIEKIDFVLNKYIEDYFFRKELRTSLLNLKVSNEEDFITSIIEKIIALFDNYEMGYTRNIYFARWI